MSFKELVKLLLFLTVFNLSFSMDKPGFIPDRPDLWTEEEIDSLDVDKLIVMLNEKEKKDSASKSSYTWSSPELANMDVVQRMAKLEELRKKEVEKRRNQEKQNQHRGFVCDPFLFASLPKIELKNLAGDIPDEITNLINKRKYQKLYSSIGFEEISQELLLVGPSGTGKSALAEAIAKELDAIFYKLSAGRLIGSYQGSGSANIRGIFEHIRNTKHLTVIFIDEVDSLSNVEMNVSNGETLRTLHDLQMEIDKKSPNIICILATNNYDKLSEAIKDRFAHNTVFVPLPNFSKRLQILYHYAQNRGVDPKFLEIIARDTEELSCRNLEKLSEQAALIAAEKHINAVIKGGSSELKKDKSKESEHKTNEHSKSTHLVVDSESQIKISKKHYLLALYITQSKKLPEHFERVLLFKYFLHKKGIHPDKKILQEIAKEADSLSAQDIKCIVENGVSFIDKKQFNILDFYFAIYYDQKVKFASAFRRAQIFDYLLKKKKTSFKQCTYGQVCTLLAYYAADDFTAREMSVLVDNASNHSVNGVITEKELIISLYRALLKKAKPFVVVNSSQISEISAKNYSVQRYDRSNWEPVTRTETQYEKRKYNSNELAQMKDENDYLEHFISGDSISKKTRFDYRTKVQPKPYIITILLKYFLEDTSHNLTENQVGEIANQMEGLSWYSIEKLVLDAKECAINDCRFSLNESDFINAAKKLNFDIKIEPKANNNEQTQHIDQVENSSSGCLLS